MEDVTEKDKKKASKDDEVKAKAKAKKAEEEEEERDEDDDEEAEEEKALDDAVVVRTPLGDMTKGTARALSAVDVMHPQRSLMNVWTIMVRELRSYFDSLVAYIVLGGSMLGI